MFMLVKGNAQDVPNDKEIVADPERNLGRRGGVLGGGGRGGGSGDFPEKSPPVVKGYSLTH